jgi:hypothetical protein
MKSISVMFLSALLIAATTGVRAQFGSVVVFAPKGEQFKLFIGNELQNTEPAARVEADNPGGPSFKLKVVFLDPSIKDIGKSIFNKPGAGTLYYKVGKNQKGAYVIEPASSEWMDEEVPKPDKPVPPPAEPKEQQKKDEGTGKSDSGKTTGTGGCENPMSEVDFAVALAGVSSHPFEGSQLSAAKKMADTHCLMAWQVKEVVNLFSMESSRLSFANYAYDHTYDRDNYDEVKDALNAQKSKDDLDKYIAGKKK